MRVDHKIEYGTSLHLNKIQISVRTSKERKPKMMNPHHQNKSTAYIDDPCDLKWTNHKQLEPAI